MKKEIADKWVAALRSGTYQQTEGFLRDGRGYCCLGVLCDLYLQDTGEGEWEQRSGNYFSLDIDGKHNGEEIPPHQVCKWAGLDTPTGLFGGADGQQLTELNDTGSTFDEIADVIQGKWEVL